ncbi:MAG TPA: hypothetical protein VFL76_03975 [Edaphocola sp.]|nr:hypothetical protein [Edaphocola sp.]
MRTIVVSTRQANPGKRSIAKKKARKAGITGLTALAVGLVLALRFQAWQWLVGCLFLAAGVCSVILYKTKEYFECYVDNGVLHIEYLESVSGSVQSSNYYRYSRSGSVVRHLEFLCSDICGYKTHSFLGSKRPNLIQIESKEGDFHCLSTPIPIEYLNKEQEALFLSFLDRLISRRQQPDDR